MKLKMKKPEEFEVVEIPDDVYTAQIAEVRELELEFGPTLAIDFNIVSDNQLGKTVSGLCSAKLTPNTKLGAWVNALGLEIKIDQELDTQTLIGKGCRIVTATKERTNQDGTKYKQSYVDKVLPLKEETKTAA